MKAIVVSKPGGLDRLEMVERETPTPGPGEILVRIRASSLNFHDYLVANGSIPTDHGRIPMSDGAGEVVEVGTDVDAFSEGDRVVSTFMPKWLDGPPSPEKLSLIPGDTADGYAAEYVAAPAQAFTHAPRHYDMTQAATLPCAAATAWHALMDAARIKPGDVVLTQGTGGVSIFALQFAKAAGATVVATSSSDEKLERLTRLGADHVINYKAEPKWGKAAKALTNGRGVDAVVEVGGPGTLPQSIKACRMGGHIAMIGVLTGLTGEVPTSAFFYSNLTMTGITVGSRAQQQTMIRAIEANGIEPVIDRTFPLAELADAFRHQESRRHFGKICLTV